MEKWTQIFSRQKARGLKIILGRKIRGKVTQIDKVRPHQNRKRKQWVRAKNCNNRLILWTEFLKTAKPTLQNCAIKRVLLVLVALIKLDSPLSQIHWSMIKLKKETMLRRLTEKMAVCLTFSNLSTSPSTCCLGTCTSPPKKVWLSTSSTSCTMSLSVS